MTEDFVGLTGKLEESFVGAVNSKLQQVAFEAFEQRAAKEKPQLLAGLSALKSDMGEEIFNKLINSLENINLADNSMLILTGDEKVRTALIAQWLPAIKKAFNVDNIRLIGGGRNGMDAY